MIRSIELQNWMRYRGVHALKLQPGVHAVVARGDRNEERSNWLGKTSLLAAVPFALYGAHTARTEDEWITRGTDSGRVELELACGAKVVRFRHRGRSTQVELHEGTDVLVGSAAQERIEQIVGLGERDFRATCFVEQKQLHRLVTAKPAELMDIVVAWLALEPLQRCEQRAAAKLKQLIEEDTRLAAREQVEKERLDGLLAELKDIDITRLKREADVASDRLQRASRDVEQQAVAGQAARDYERVTQLGIALKRESTTPLEQLKAAMTAAEQTCEKVAVEVSKARERLRTVKCAAAGFDGVCPVILDQCPCRERVTQIVRERRSLRDDAETNASVCEQQAKHTRQALQASRAMVAEEEARIGKLAGLREQAKALKQRAAGATVDLYVQAVREAEEAGLAARAACKALDHAMLLQREADTLMVSLSNTGDQRVALADQIATYRTACAVFGRQGAQRAVAEAALAEIEDGANAILAEAGIDLRLEVRWSREAATKGVLEESCSKCGTPFSTSRKVKACEKCGTPRGQKVIDKLHVRQSDKSGAADDLAGLALQLSGAAWLREERGAAWDVAFIDEPFGSLDRANCEALASQLARMLSGRYGFTQAFVVAHDRGLMDAMPERIEIIGDAEGSKFA